MKTLFIFTFHLALVALIGMSASSSKMQPPPGSVKIFVVQKGVPVPGEKVWVFNRGSLECVCNGGQCIPNSVATGTTALKDQKKPPTGQVVFTGLPAGDYVAAIEVRCNQAQTPCQGNQQCGIYHTGIANFTVDNKGNSGQVAIQKP